MQLLQEVIELNQAFDRVIAGLKRMEKVSFLQAPMVREDRAEVVLAQIDFNLLRRTVRLAAAWPHKTWFTAQKKGLL